MADAEPVMQRVLNVKFQVIYYGPDGKKIYHPADRRHEVLAEALRKARSEGLDARLSEVAA